MTRKQSIQDLRDDQLRNQRVLVRADFNVPIENGKVVSDHRIVAVLPTLRYLLERQAKVIIVTHVGRPKGEVNPEFSVQPVVAHLKTLLPETTIQLVAMPFGPQVNEAVETMPGGSITVLENIRFEPGETKNDEALSKKLASIADIYVNDAFGTSHRAHSSTEGVAHFVPIKVAGLLLNQELTRFHDCLDHPKRPFVAVLGGSKVSTKIGVINHLLNVVDTLVIGGGMTYTFLKAQGYEVGKSICEPDFLDTARQAMADAERLGKTLLIPTDVVVADDFSATANTQVVAVDAMPADWEGVDTGPNSIAAIEAVLRDAQSVVWNGPVGVFEMVPFAKGTFAIARTIAELTQNHGLMSVIGGGDTEAAIKAAGLSDAQFTHVSTGGGASLEFLEGKTLPGVAVLQDLCMANSC